MIGCMGGWCGRRAECARHVYPRGGQPSERLCPRGELLHFLSVMPITGARSVGTPPGHDLLVGAALSPRVAPLIGAESMAIWRRPA